MKPIVKWAGGKTQLLDEIKKRMPRPYDINNKQLNTTYWEPFFGGGALYFELQPKQAIINDLNTPLMELYKNVKTNKGGLIYELDKLENGYNGLTETDDRRKFYYKSRERFNSLKQKEPSNVETSALFIFLNKCCFNGLYRENKSGEFNAPWGQKKTVNLYDAENLDAVSKQLQTAYIVNSDYRKMLDWGNIGENDFIFIDSPYHNTFDTYQQGGFSEADHIQLKELVDEIQQKGGLFMLTNNDDEFIRDLYKEYIIDSVPVKRMINRDGNNRKGREVIITNYNYNKEKRTL